eukprot:TRINITY_DN398_c0_g6_i1.p1 TRINITY_DN398_c0_g6~~TRINITY_DN398_c0_g6_i1.p1  ORF type:complete len:1452 (+),score=529.06 TRINITY_DN398_c0_g6_i1:87-4358(+)
MAQHADPRLARLMAPAAQRPAPQPHLVSDRLRSGQRSTAAPAPQAAPCGAVGAVTRQADGHRAVRFRRTLQEATMCLIPDGSALRVTARDGEWLRVEWQGIAGYVKARNVAAAPAALSSPAPAAPPVAASAGAGQCTFTVNGKQYSVDADTVGGMTSVHDWVFANVPGSGLRRNCGVGRCGVCVAMLSYTDPATGQLAHRAFNTCLRPMLSCNGMAITTNGGIGTSAAPHPVQKALADHSGTQCGFCSAGQVMSIYAQLAAKGAGAAVSAKELEHCLDGNLCRCTGYRPIIDTAKSFAADAPAPRAAPLTALDASVIQRPPAAPAAGAVPLPVPPMPQPPPAPLAAGAWTEVRTEADLQKSLKAHAGAGDLMLVGGNTSHGIWPERKPDALVSIAQIPALRTLSAAADVLVVGAAVSLTDAQEFLQAQAKGTPALGAIAEHVLLSPGTPIRNCGTVGGNVMIMHEHQKDGQSFCTEWPMLLQAWGATLCVVDSDGGAREYSFEDFWGLDMRLKYIRHFTLPLAGAQGRTMRSFRTSVRHLYAQQYLGAAMRVTVDPATGKVAAGSARIVYNNIVSHPIRATALEQALEGAAVTDEAHLQNVLFPALEKLIATPDPALYGPVPFRQQLARSYFYKFMLALQPSVAPRLQTAVAAWLPRDVQEGTQTFQTDTSVYPLNEPIPKIDGLRQTCSEAQYVQDVPIPSNCLHGAPVLATAVGKISKVDTSAAEKLPGWQGWLSHKDVPLLSPGVLAGADLGKQVFQPLFAKGETIFIGQVVGLCLADSQQRAVDCARAVSVSYSSQKAPLVLTMEDAIKAGSYMNKSAGSMKQGDVGAAFASADHVANDSLSIQEQIHYHMESQSAMAVPGEDALVVHASTQEPKVCHLAVQLLLTEIFGKIDIRQRRLGGGFGGKLEASAQVACLSAFAAKHLKRPVRVVMELADNMVAIGRRVPFHGDLQVGFMKDGTITAVQAKLYFGNAGGDTDNAIRSVDNCYSIPNWDIAASVMKLDLPITRSCRAPGWLPGIWFSERVIGLVSAQLGMPAAQIRERNFYKAGQVTPYGMPLKEFNMQDIWAKLKASSNYDARAVTVAKFNASSRWVKKGIALVPSKFSFQYLPGLNFASTLMMDCRVTVNADGSVTVLAGGTEMGQGLTTKVAQTVSYYLGCAVSDVVFAEQSSLQMGSVVTGIDLTGGSIGSELCSLAAKNACAVLTKNLAPVRKVLGPSAAWKEVAAKAHEMGVELSVKKSDEHHAPAVDKKGDVYNTYGAVCAEVTLDVLTGQTNFERCDLVFDIGRSVNPDVDVGQLEGGFMFGLGLALMEDVSYTPTGAMHSGAATYEPPGTVDVPREWHVSLFNGKVNAVTPNGAKAIGEPPVTMAYAAVDALEQALAAAAKDAGTGAHPRPVSLPFTIDQRQLASAVTTKQFTLK